MLFIRLLNWLKRIYCALIYSHDDLVSYEYGGYTSTACVRCGHTLSVEKTQDE